MDVSDYIPLLVFWWIAASIAVGIAANVRGRNRQPWFWLSFFLGPILAVLLLIAFPAKFATGVSSSN